MTEKKNIKGKTVGGLLAAGSSKRMGKLNKLLHEIDGIPMVRKIAIEMVESNLDNCFAVLGYQSQKVSKALANLPIQLIINENWDRGKSSSIRALANRVDSDTGELLIMLGDLPGVTKFQINYLLEYHQNTLSSNASISIPSFEKKRGNPVVWGNNYIMQLRRLTGEVGGKTLFKNNFEKVNFVKFESDAIISDIDTHYDLEKWEQKNQE